MKRVIVGGVSLDHILPVLRLRVGLKHRIRDCPEAVIGGGAANDAISGVALAPGTQFTLFAHVGNDDAGATILGNLEQRGITMPLEPCEDLPTSESFIISESDFNGRGTIISIHGARARELPLQPIREALVGAGAFCLCSPPLNTQIAVLLQAARFAHVPAYFALGSAQVNELSYDALASHLDSSVELVICNHSEATRLTGTEDIVAQLRALRFSGRGRVSVVTCGEDGLSGFDNLGIRQQDAYRDERPVIDDTGAGDATAAAIIDALLRGLPLDKALACGARNGFEACTGRGVKNVCTRRLMDAYLESRKQMAA